MTHADNTRLPLGGYVLAGGRSTRMGRDKALLELAGKPLAQLAVTKLRRLTPDVSILSNRAELAQFAPLVPDRHQNCGPIGGLDAALAHTHHDWTLVLPVDMPFLPASVLHLFVQRVAESRTARIALFTVNTVLQPALCLLHRDVGPFINEAVRAGKFKLYPVLENAARDLAASQNLPASETLLNWIWEEREAEILPFVQSDSRLWLTESQLAARHLWFANLNTPEEFREAELHADALDA
jgi:molybdopterin-guanine dinucleotide biosynthesis protein A